VSHLSGAEWNKALIVVRRVTLNRGVLQHCDELAGAVDRHDTRRTSRIRICRPRIAAGNLQGRWRRSTSGLYSGGRRSRSPLAHGAASRYGTSGAMGCAPCKVLAARNGEGAYERLLEATSSRRSALRLGPRRECSAADDGSVGGLCRRTQRGKARTSRGASHRSAECRGKAGSLAVFAGSRRCGKPHRSR
jgi:hypothetical protein